FNPNDAEFFFGRDVFVEELFEATQNRNFIPVLGASGSGKSSVVLAGLVPKLEKEGHWKFTHFRPGSDPFHALALALVPLYRPELDATDEIIQARKLAKSLSNDRDSEDNLPLSDVFAKIKQNNPNHRILLIADQFEELYTQCSDSTVRRRFLDCLLSSFQSSNSGASSSTVLVTTMRADFLANALGYRPFADMLQNADIKLGAMSREELTEVIEKPAENLEVTFEAGLVERILNDVEDEPGNLPLLEFALTELWEKRTGKQLTHDTYEAIGQVKGALADYADDKYQKLTEEEQEQARRIFIQLVRPGEGTEDTRRRANRSELEEENWDLITRKDGLADSRLVVTSRNDSEQDTVEVVHEALIQNWGQLREWMETDRKFRVWQEQLRVVSHQWKNTNQDEGALLRGATLLQAEDWQRKRKEELSQTEQDFIRLSTAFRDEEIKKEKRRQRQIISWLTGGLIAALGLTGIALLQWQKALIEEIKTITTSVETSLALNQEFEALMASMRAAKKMKNTFGVDFETRIKVIGALQNSFHRAREFNTFSGHQDLVWDVNFSPDGQIIASASYDNTVKIWNLKGELLKTIIGHTDTVKSVSFSPDGKIIASASSDDTIKLWNLKGELLKTFTGHTDIVNSVNFSPNGKIIASASDDDTVKLWNLEGELLQTFTDHTGGVNSISFSPDGKVIASASRDQTIKIWNLEGELFHSLAGHTNMVNDISFSSDGKVIASASSDNTTKLWNLKGELLQTFTGHTGGVNSISFSPGGKVIASASSDNTIKLWNLKGELLQTFTGHTGIVNSIRFSPDGHIITSASNDNTIKFWSVTKKILTFIEGDTGDNITTFLNYLQKYPRQGNKFSFNSNGKIIASVSEDIIKIHNIEGQLLQTLLGHTSKVNSVDFSPNGEIIASTSNDSSIKIWSLEGELLQIIEEYNFDISVKELSELASDQSGISLWKFENFIKNKTLSFSDDGQIIAFVSNKNIHIWDLERERLMNTLVGHKDIVRSINFSPNGRNIISSSYDNTVKLWDLKGNLLKNFTGYDANFSPDGKIIALANYDNTIQFWDLNGELITTIEGDRFLFSPDGKTIASSSEDKTIKIWNLGGELLATLRGHKDYILSVNFSFDGKTIASSSEDKTIKIWNLNGDLISTLTGHEEQVIDLVFSPDNMTIASASTDKTINLWILDLDKLMIKGCNWIRDYLEYNTNLSENDKSLCNTIQPNFLKKKQQAKPKPIEQNKEQEVIATFSRVIELQPKSIDAYLRRSQAYYILEEYQKALDDLGEAIKLEPERSDSYWRRGIIHHKLEEYQKAIADYNQAITIDYGFLPHKNIGLINYEVEDDLKAVKIWVKALTINEDRMTLLKKEVGENSYETDVFLEASKLVKERAEALLAISVAFYTKGNQEKAFELAEKALKQDKRLANLEFLKENLWGDKLLSDTQKLFEAERIKAITSPTSEVLEKQ
ncbi:MAG: tetratricopeptide repeat protein, partial [Xenococcus sp. (in: cyanobacteria)]